MFGRDKGLIRLEFFIIITFPSQSFQNVGDNSASSPDLNNNSQAAKDGQGDCVPTYERAETVVYDTIYQHQCINVTLPKCQVTHIPQPRDVLQTRCVPSYDTRCKLIKKEKLEEECRMEYKAECSQVLLQRFRTDYTSECDDRGLCTNIAEQKPTTVPRHKCQSVRRKKCKKVPHIRLERKCVFLPTQSCNSVPVKVNVDIPQEKCEQFYQELRTHCQNVPVKMARVVGKLVPKLKCPQTA